MDVEESVNLTYASSYARIANYWKNRQGMIDALTAHKTAQIKRKSEKKFNSWANKNANKATYGKVVSNINTYYKLTNNKAKHDNYLISILRSSKFSILPYRLGSGFKRYIEANENRRNGMLERLTAFIDDTYTDYHLPLEKEILTEQLKLYASKSDYKLPKTVADVAKNNGFDAYVDAIFELSMFTSKERAKAFLDYPNMELLENDPLYVLSSDLLAKYREEPEELKQPLNNFQASYRLLVDGLRKSGLSKIKYPDANSTLRLTYGKVRALPKDARNDAEINNYTTLKGMINKYKPNNKEFDLPSDMLKIYQKKDYGRYADKKGHLPVNFLTDNDITGGNSGSPVLNGKGELIGLAFDGNIEAMAGDVIFDKKLQRTINVDIRYVLWLIDKYSNAKHIVDELTIVTK
jgi:hypothetical protein